jgi:hypothetical protein
MSDSTRSFVAKATAPHLAAPSLCRFANSTELMRSSTHLVVDVADLFTRKNVALPGPRSIRGIETTEWACQRPDSIMTATPEPRSDERHRRLASEISTGLIGSERVRRHPHRADCSASQCGLSGSSVDRFPTSERKKTRAHNFVRPTAKLRLNHSYCVCTAL